MEINFHSQLFVERTISAFICRCTAVVTFMERVSFSLKISKQLCAEPIIMPEARSSKNPRILKHDHMLANRTINPVWQMTPRNGYCLRCGDKGTVTLRKKKKPDGPLACTLPGVIGSGEDRLFGPKANVRGGMKVA